MGISALLVATGSSGFRTLQGLGSATDLDSIYIFGANAEGEERLKEMSKADSDLSSKKLVFLRELSELSSIPDIAISGVTAGQQVLAFQKIFHFFGKLPPSLILEEPLAGGRPGLEALMNIAPHARVLSYRDHWKGYSRIKNELFAIVNGAECLRFEFVGNMRGLGANGIRYIQLFRMLSGAKRLRVLKANLFEAEHRFRGDWKEYEGEICIEADNKHEFRLVCTDIAGGSAIFDPPAIYIRDNNNRILYKIDEAAGKVIRHDELRFDLERIVLCESVNFAIEGILRVGNPGLPLIQDSYIDHMALFSAFELALGSRDDFGIS